MSREFETIHALRSDVALQIARYTARLGVSQLAAARQLSVPQPTLSKIINGNTSDLSLELLLRIAMRAGLRLTLQTGIVPQEAGAFVSSGRPFSARTFPSKIAGDTHASIDKSLRELTPAQRIEAFLEHNQLVSELRRAGQGAEESPLPRVLARP